MLGKQYMFNVCNPKNILSKFYGIVIYEYHMFLEDVQDMVFIDQAK